MKLRFITSNEGKVREARALLSPLGYDVVQAQEPYPEIQAQDLEAVARAGAEHLKKTLDGAFFLEDSGLFIDALGGFPGVYSRYVFDTLGCDGILTLLGTSEKRTAQFKTVIAYYDGTVRLFTGICRGTIMHEKRGSGGFGFDPIFIPDGAARCFAEMTDDEKNRYSHRGSALRAFAAFLTKKESA